MFLTEANYFSPEANWEFLSVSQYKDFCGTMKQRGCEAKAMAKLRGEWVEEQTEAMLLGSYVDAHFEGTLDFFRMKHPEIFRKTDSELYESFQKAEKAIQMAEADELFMTDIVVTLKKMNFSQSKIVNLDNKAGRTKLQLIQQKDKGTAKGTKQ